MGGKDEPQICARDESCLFDSWHEILKVRIVRLAFFACRESLMRAESLWKINSAQLGGMSWSDRLMNWGSWGVFHVGWLKNLIATSSSNGRSILEMKSSKYSLAPRKSSVVRAGRTVRTQSGRRWLSLLGRECGEWNPRQSDSSLVKEDKQATIASGEMYSGMCTRRRWTRSLAIKCSSRIAGNGMKLHSSDRRRGADPPKNDSGTISPLLSYRKSVRDVSSGKGYFIIAMKRSNSDIGTAPREIRQIRSGCSSAAMMLSAPSISDFMSPLLCTMTDKAGQICSIFLTGVFAVQRSRSCRWRGDAKATCRHLRHTWTSVCHSSVRSAAFPKKKNISKRTSSGTVPIVTFGGPIPQNSVVSVKVTCALWLTSTIFVWSYTISHIWALGGSYHAEIKSVWSNCLVASTDDRRWYRWDLQHADLEHAWMSTKSGIILFALAVVKGPTLTRCVVSVSWLNPFVSRAPSETLAGGGGNHWLSLRANQTIPLKNSYRKL